MAQKKLTPEEMQKLEEFLTIDPEEFDSLIHCGTPYLHNQEKNRVSLPLSLETFKKLRRTSPKEAENWPKELKDAYYEFEGKLLDERGWGDYM